VYVVLDMCLTYLHQTSSGNCNSVRCVRYVLDLSPSDILWNLSDPGWAKAAYSNVYCPWIAGSCVFIHSCPTFDPELVMKVSKYVQCCSVAGVVRTLLKNLC